MEVAFRVLFSLVMGRISKLDSDIAFIEEMGKSRMISKKMSGDFFAGVWGGDALLLFNFKESSKTEMKLSRGEPSRKAHFFSYVFDIQRILKSMTGFSQPPLDLASKISIISGLQVITTQMNLLEVLL